MREQACEFRGVKFKAQRSIFQLGGLLWPSQAQWAAGAKDREKSNAHVKAVTMSKVYFIKYIHKIARHDVSEGNTKIPVKLFASLLLLPSYRPYVI